MKLLIPFTLVLTFTYTNLLAQQSTDQPAGTNDDSAVISVGMDSLQEAEKSYKYNYIDQQAFERKTMFKYAIPGWSTFSPHDRMSIEQKLWPSLSVEAGWMVPYIGVSGVFTQLRYYPSKRRGAADGKSKINNFTGNYISFGTARGFDNRGPNSFNLSHSRNYVGQSYSLSVGRQQKVGKWGFVDLSGNLEYFSSTETMQLGLKALGGLAYGISKPADGKLYPNRYEAFKEEYNSTRSLLTISDPAILWSSDYRTIEVGVDYERYLLNNFTFISTMDFSASHIGQFHPTLPRGVERNGYEASYSFQFRYYYSTNRRLMRGLDASPFFGPHVSLGVRDLFKISRYESVNDDTSPREKSTYSGFNQAKIQASWGTRHQIGKRSYFGLSLGFEYTIETKDLEFVPTASIGFRLGK